MKRVTLEPDLEEIAGKFNPRQRRQLAAQIERWAHQLRVSADIIDRDAGQKPRSTLAPMCSAKLRRN